MGLCGRGFVRFAVNFVFVFAARGFRHAGCGEAGAGAHRGFDRLGDLGVVPKKLLGVFAALADAFGIIGEPGAGFFNNAFL